MKIDEMAEKLGLVLKTNMEGEFKEISSCYIGDLLSLAMSHVSEGDVWITVQTNINTVAVATLKEAGCIILPEGLSPDEDTAKKAAQEDIPIYSGDDSAYVLAAKLSQLGI